MLHCGKCGFQVTEEMQFCPNCGAPLKTQPFFQKEADASAEAESVFMLVRTTPFVDGVVVGLGVTMLVASLLLGSFLSSDYLYSRDNLLAIGVSPREIPFLLSSNVLLISFSAYFAIIGAYISVMGTVSYRYRSVWTALDNMRRRARRGSRLVGAGTAVLGLSTSWAVNSLYSSDTLWVWPSVLFGIASIALILSGSFFIATARPKRGAVETQGLQQ